MTANYPPPQLQWALKWQVIECNNKGETNETKKTYRR